MTPQLNPRGGTTATAQTGFSTRTSSNSDQSWESDSDQWPTSKQALDYGVSQWQGRHNAPESQWQTRTINGSQWQQGKHNKLVQQWPDEGGFGNTQKRTHCVGSGVGNSVSMKLATPLVYHRSYATRNQRQGKAYV